MLRRDEGKEIMKTVGKYEKNLVSILVPVYNVGKYIRKCLDSILVQTYPKLEIILIDDGSTDESGKICDEYASKDARIMLIHKHNGGVTSARKAGLKMAKGEYIGFVDPDDWIEPNMYKEMLKCMLETKTDLVHTNRIKEIGKTNYTVKEHKELYVLTDLDRNVDFLKSVLDGRFPLVLWLNLFKHELIKECYDCIPDYFGNGEDYAIIVGYMLKCRSITFLPASFYHYIKRTGSIQHNADINLMVTTAKQFETINLFINGSKLKFVLKPYLNKCFIRRMLFIINTTNIIKPIPIYIPDSLDYLKGKRIVICGAGTIGKDYYIYLSRHHDYNIVMWVDDIPSNYYKERVCPVANIMNCDYDLILIAVEKEDLAIQIRKSLIEQGALPDKIYWKSPRSIIDDEIINDDTI